MSNPNWNNGLLFLQFCYSVCVMLKMSFRKLPLQTHHCEELYINTYVINHIWVTLPFKLCCSVTELCPILCEPMDCSTPGPSVPHYLIKFAQVHIHCIGGAIQTSHPLMPSFPSALNLSQHQGLFWVLPSYFPIKRKMALLLIIISITWETFYCFIALIEIKAM